MLRASRTGTIIGRGIPAARVAPLSICSQGPKPGINIGVVSFIVVVGEAIRLESFGLYQSDALNWNRYP